MAEELARFVDRWTIEYIRFYPHPIERVWRAIAEPKELGSWFITPTKWDLAPGGVYRFHDDDFAGVIVRVEPPRFIRFGGPASNGPEAFFEFTLEPAPGGTRLIHITHATPGFPFPYGDGAPEEGGDLPGGLDTPWRPGMMSGWHVSFDDLSAWLADASVEGGRPAGEQSIWREMNATYRSHIKANCPPA